MTTTNDTSPPRPGSFVTHVSVLAVSNAAAQVLSILAFPITSRLFSPEAFGIAATFISLSGILVVLVSLRYELAIVLPKKDGIAASLFSLCTVITVGFSIALALATWLFGPQLLSIFRIGELTPYIWMLPVFVGFTGLSTIINYWYLRFRDFNKKAGIRILAKSAHISAQILFGVLGYTSGGYLIAALILFPVSQSILFLLIPIGFTLRQIVRESSVALMADAARQYRKFPLYNSWSGLLNTASQLLPTIVITALFGPKAAGFFSRALALIQVPFFMISTSIRDVFFQRVSAMKASGEDIAEFVAKVIKKLFALILFPMIMIFLLGTDIFIVVAGVQWFEAGIYTRLLAPWLLVSFIGYPIGVLFFVMELQNIELIFNILLFIARVAALAVGGIMLNDARAAVLLFSGVSVFFYIWLVHYFVKRNGISRLRILGSFFSYLLFATPTVVLTALGKWWFHLAPVINILVGVTMSSIYIVILVHRDPEIRGILAHVYNQVRGRN